MTDQELASRHLEQWEAWRRDAYQPALASGDPEAARQAKALADALAKSQEAEAKSLASQLAADDGGLRIVWEGS